MSAAAGADLYSAIFYDGLAVPGALLLGASGLLLKSELGLGWLERPWFTGMWGLFLFEVVEGNTVTRLQFRRTLRRSRAALSTGVLSTEVRAEARSPLGQITHFLDVPLFLVIVWCGVMQPDSWRQVATAVGVALIAAGLLTALVPRLARRDRPASAVR